MSNKRKPSNAISEELPGLPDLPGLGDLPDIGDLPELNLDEGEELVNPFDEIEEQYDDKNVEEASALDDKVIDSQFAKIREGREQQRVAVELANNSEYWCALYFQTQEQKDAFLKAMKWFEHGDKYLDGQWVAKKQGIELPPRPAPYKVGRIDQKLKGLT